MTKNEENNNFEKKDYIPPLFEVIYVEMECGLMANSGIMPGMGDNNTTHEWEVDEDVNKEISFE